MRRIVFWLVGIGIALAFYLSGLTIQLTRPTERAAVSNAQQAAQAFAPAATDGSASVAAPLRPDSTAASTPRDARPAALASATPVLTATPLPTAPAEAADEAILPSQAVAPGAEPGQLSLQGLPSDVTNILVLGSDRRSKADPGRTDVIMLVSVDRVNKMVRMLSIPRDLWVYIPGVGYNRINTAHVFGAYTKKPGAGPALVKETIKYNLGLRIDRYVVLDFNGFKDVVNTLGGVDVDVPCGLYDGDYIQLAPGHYHLNGDQALRYARSRYSTSDFSRAARQQQIIRNLWEQTPKGQLLFKIPQLWATYNERVDTDLTLPELMSLGALAAQLRPESIKSRVLTYPNVSPFTTDQGAMVLRLIPAGYQRLLADLFGASQMTVTSDKPMEAVDEEPPARVVVLNGTPKKDLASLAASAMRDETGIAPHAVGTAFTTDYPKTLLLDYGAPASDLDRLSKFFGVAAIRLARTLTDDTPDVVVVLGADYKSCKGR